MSNFPLVTVGVLSFNTGKFVTETLKSIFSSSYSNLEVICIDDASEDQSAQLLTSLSQVLSFKFIKNQQNVGLVANCNTLLNMASGKYILIIGDDLVLEHRILKDVALLEAKPEVAFVCSQVRLIDQNSRPIEDHRGSRVLKPGIIKDTAVKVWLKGSDVSSPTVTHRVQVLREVGGFETSFEIEDRPLYLKLAKRGFLGWHRDEVTTLYRRHSQNLSAKFRKSMFLEDANLVKTLELPIAPFLIKLKALSEVHYWMLNHQVSSFEAKDALRLASLSGLVWTIDSFLFRFVYLLRSKIVGSKVSLSASISYLWRRRQTH